METTLTINERISACEKRHDEFCREVEASERELKELRDIRQKNLMTFRGELIESSQKLMHEMMQGKFQEQAYLDGVIAKQKRMSGTVRFYEYSAAFSVSLNRDGKFAINKAHQQASYLVVDDSKFDALEKVVLANSTALIDVSQRYCDVAPERISELMIIAFVAFYRSGKQTPKAVQETKKLLEESESIFKSKETLIEYFFDLQQT